MKDGKTTQNRIVRAALARNGHFPDTYIKDKNSYVRFEVLNQHPEYLIELFKKLDDRVKAYYELNSKSQCHKRRNRSWSQVSRPWTNLQIGTKIKITNQNDSTISTWEKYVISSTVSYGSPFWTLPFNARQVKLISQMGKINPKYKNELGECIKSKTK